MIQIRTCLQIWRCNCEKFLRSLAQPTNPKDLEGVSIWNIEQLQEYQQQFQKDEMDIDEEDLDLL